MESGMIMNGEERDAGGEDQAVNKDDEAGFFQIGQLGMLDLAIDLGHGLFAAHGQDRMSQADENADQPDGVGQLVWRSQPSASLE